MATFAYHRGIAPMMWAFASLAIIELVVVHFVVAMHWPSIGWPLTILSATGLVWLIAWIRSFAKRPHRLEGGVLHLYCGSLRHLGVPLENVARVESQWQAGAMRAPGAINLALIAHPNRVLHLEQPCGRLRTIFLRLDDPVAFDAALAGR